MTAPIFSRPVALNSIPAAGFERSVSATADERAALAKSLGLLELKSLSATLTVLPVPVTAIAPPVGEAPRLLLTVTGTALLPDRVTDRVATTPSGIILEFNPHAMHV